MQRRSSQSKTQLMNFSGFLFSTAWVTSLTATIFFPFISSFHRLSSNIWNSYNIHRHIFIFPGYIMNQLNRSYTSMKTLSPGFPYEVASECTSETAESTLQRQQQKCIFILNWSEWLICKSQATVIHETCEMPFGHPWVREGIQELCSWAVGLSTIRF